MNKNNGLVLALIFTAIISVYDAFTTFIGVEKVMNNDFIALVFTIVINGILVAAYPVLKNRIEYFGLFLKIFLAIALMCDLYTSYLGNLQYSGLIEVEGAQVLILFCLSLLVTGCPLMVSYLVFERDVLKEFKNNAS